MCPEVVNLRKTRILRVGKGPPLAPITETETGNEHLQVYTFQSDYCYYVKHKYVHKALQGVYSWFCFSSRFSLDRNVYSIRHFTDIYLHIYTLLPYNSSVNRPMWSLGQPAQNPTQVPDTNILIAWFIKLYKYTSHIKFTMHLISTNKYFHLPLPSF